MQRRFDGRKVARIVKLDHVPVRRGANHGGDAHARVDDHLTYLEPPVAVAPQWRTFLGALEAWRARATADQCARTVGTAVGTFAAVESALAGEGLA